MAADTIKLVFALGVSLSFFFDWLVCWLSSTLCYVHLKIFFLPVIRIVALKYKPKKKYGSKGSERLSSINEVQSINSKRTKQTDSASDEGFNSGNQSPETNTDAERKKRRRARRPQSVEQSRSSSTDPRRHQKPAPKDTQYLSRIWRTCQSLRWGCCTVKLSYLEEFLIAILYSQIKRRYSSRKLKQNKQTTYFDNFVYSFPFNNKISINLVIM